MKYALNLRILLSLLALILTSLACGLGQPAATPTRIPATARLLPTKEPTIAPTDTQEPTATEPPTGNDTGSLMHEWASTGEASSEYGSDAWSALQVAGAPDTLTCGDNSTAWASADSTTRESITAYFMDEPLIPSGINIVQSYHPSQVVKVELIDANSEHSDATIYQGKPKAVTQCPYTLSIPVTGIDYPIMGVRVTIDQSVLGLGWNEIDAIELVGETVSGLGMPPTAEGLPEGIWADVHALPILPTAKNVNYPDEKSLGYTVSDSNRQEVFNSLVDELQKIGWMLDADFNGNCATTTICMSKLAGLDYGSPNNTLWYFIHSDSPDAGLTLVVTESSGIVSVSMGLY
jgi:hypothetical protein